MTKTSMLYQAKFFFLFKIKKFKAKKPFFAVGQENISHNIQKWEKTHKKSLTSKYQESLRLKLILYT